MSPLNLKKKFSDYLAFGVWISLLGAAFTCVSGCQGNGQAAEKEETVAFVGENPIYASDVEMYRKDLNLNQYSKDYRRRMGILLRDEALAAEGLQQFKSLGEKARDYLERMNLRMLSSVYQRFYAFEKLFFTDRELKDYYNAHRADFKEKNSLLLTYEEARPRVAEALYLEKHATEFEKFLDEKVKAAGERASADVEYVLLNDSLSAAAVYARVIAEKKFQAADVARILRVTEGDSSGLFGKQNVAKEFFRKGEVPRLGFGEMDSPKRYVVYRVLASHPAVPGNKEVLKSSAQKEFLKTVRSMIQDTTGKFLVQKYQLRVAPKQEVPAETIYKRDSSAWKTDDGLWIYHIQKSDSMALVLMAQKLNTEETFRQAVLTQNENAAENQEFLKRQKVAYLVRENHALPYGIGVLPSLFNDFKNGQTGLSPIYATEVKGENKAYHLFYVQAIEKGKIKPFARVKKTIKQMLAGGLIAGDSLAPLVLAGEKTVLTERDMLRFAEEIPKQKRSRFSREMLASYLMEWYALASETRALKLDQSPEYKALVRKMKRDFLRKAIQDSLSKPTLLDTVAVRPIFERYGKAFAGHSVETILPELSLLAQVHENDIRYVYYSNRAPSDTSNDYLSALPTLLPELRRNFPDKNIRRFSVQAEKNHPLKILRPGIFDASTYGISAKAYVAYADSLQKNGLTDYARWEWSVLRARFPEDAEAYARATLELAKLESDFLGFAESAKEYAALIGMFPNRPEAESGLFAYGFLLEENLNRKQEALLIYKRFMEKYPKSSRFESAKWLAENIESGGRLSEELFKKIEAQPD